MSDYIGWLLDQTSSWTLYQWALLGIALLPSVLISICAYFWMRYRWADAESYNERTLEIDELINRVKLTQETIFPATYRRNPLGTAVAYELGIMSGGVIELTEYNDDAMYAKIDRIEEKINSIIDQ